MGTDLLRRYGDRGMGRSELKSFMVAAMPAFVSRNLDGALVQKAAERLAITVRALLGIGPGTIDLVHDLLSTENLCANISY